MYLDVIDSRAYWFLKLSFFVRTKLSKQTTNGRPVIAFRQLVTCARKIPSVGRGSQYAEILQNYKRKIPRHAYSPKTLTFSLLKVQ